MSVVSSIIITCSLGEEENEGVFPPIDDINEYLRSQRKGELKNLGGHEGGGKAWQVEVFGGAFNYLDIQEFANALKNARWKEPENVTIFIAGEHDEIMRQVRLTPNQYAFNEEAEQLQQALNEMSVAP